MTVQALKKSPWRERALPPTSDPSPSRREGSELQAARLGEMDYLQAWDLQRAVTLARREERVPDMLLLFEHPHTYTLGRSGKKENILLSASELERHGIAVYEVDRGGDVTYHGPDQLVGYPILKLPKDRYTFVRYIRDLERALLAAVRDLGVPGELNDGYSGVWVGEEKACAIGVKVDAYGVTSHGFAMNVNTDLSYFGHIIPCGIQGKGVTSLQRLLGRRVSMRRVEQVVIERIAETFGLEPAGRSVGLERLRGRIAPSPSNDGNTVAVRSPAVLL